MNGEDMRMVGVMFLMNVRASVVRVTGGGCRTKVTGVRTSMEPMPGSLRMRPLLQRSRPLTAIPRAPWMCRIWISGLMLCWAGHAFAQEQGIDGEFSRLTAKERTRIAKEEEQGASVDARFQQLMTEAEGLFRAKHYEEALRLFTEARDLRPYNVYPRVKIQDLQALLARLGEVPVVEGNTGAEGTLPSSGIVPALQDDAPAFGNAAMDDASGIDVTPPPPDPAPSPRRPSGPGVEGEDRSSIRISERVHKEGRAVVLERCATLEGKTVAFRKVMHPWGEVVYFRDGVAIPDHVWYEVFGDR